MGETNSFLLRTSDRPSVFALNDRDLASEYTSLTGFPVQTPSSRNPSAWWQWRSDLQEKVLRARSSLRTPGTR